jgi:hypothetical protein
VPSDEDLASSHSAGDEAAAASQGAAAESQALQQQQYYDASGQQYVQTAQVKRTHPIKLHHCVS